MEYEFELSLGESIIIDGVTLVKVTSIRSDRVKLGFEGPHEVWREEIPVEADND